MTIATYAELQTAIGDYLARSDLTSRIPDFIALAEGHFNRELRTREMVTFSTLTMTAGVGVLPADFLEWSIAQWAGTRTRDLKYCEPDSEQWRFRYRPNGDPEMFTIVNRLNIAIRPAVTGSVVLVYYQAVPALVTNLTNWLLTKSPDLYVYQSLAEAYLYQKDNKKAAEFIALVDAQIAKANVAADSNKLSRRPAAKPPGDDTGTG